MESFPYYDTAGAARMLAKEKPKMAGAIASRICAELYGLEIVKEHIEDCPANYTRFIVLSKKENQQGGDKCSIIFSTPHKAGALFETLRVFSEAKINLTRIESIPHQPGSDLPRTAATSDIIERAIVIPLQGLVMNSDI